MITKNIKVILAFLLGMVITIPSVYAVNKYLSSDVTYKDTTVENALNELYDNKKCVTGNLKHESNSQIEINIGFQPKILLFTHMHGGAYEYTVYDNKNGYFYYFWYDNGEKNVTKQDKISIDNGVLKTSYGTSWERYTYSYDVYYVACK
jgi:hypothetical protein